MSDSIILSKISPFEGLSYEIKRLPQEKPYGPINSFYQFCLKSFETPKKRWNQHVKAAIFHAEAILKQMPEYAQNREYLKERLKDKNFKILLANQQIPLETAVEDNFLSSTAVSRGISHGELVQFYRDMDQLFKKIYPNLRENPFSRNNKMPKLVQEYLSSDLRRFNKLKKTGSNDEEERTKRKIAKGKLAVSLGFGIEANKGATGTLIIKDVNDIPVGVLKVSERDVPIIIRILNIIKSFIGGQLTYLSRKNFAQPLSERAAYLVSKELGFHVVPASAVTSIKKKIGVFQVFVAREGENPKRLQGSPSAKHLPNEKSYSDYFEAKHVIDLIDSKKTFSDQEKTKFQKFAIFDYLIGNLDRHLENWFVTFSKEMELTHIKAIDNANAFPKKQPAKGSMATRNQYKWQTHNLAKQEFTKETIHFVNKNLSPFEIRKAIALIKQDLPGFLDLDMEKLFLLRANVAYSIVHESAQSPADLAACSSMEDIQNYLFHGSQQ